MGAGLLVVWVAETFALGYCLAKSQAYRDENDVLRAWRDSLATEDLSDMDSAVGDE